MASRRYNRGSWQLERERFQLDEVAEPPAPDRVSAVGALLPGLLKSLKLEDRYWEQTLLNEWPAIAAATVAKHSRPGRVQYQTLTVFVRGSTWLNELSRYGKQQLLANVQAKFGADRIKSVRFQLDPDGAR